MKDFDGDNDLFTSKNKAKLVFCQQEKNRLLARTKFQISSLVF